MLHKWKLIAAVVATVVVSISCFFGGKLCERKNVKREIASAVKATRDSVSWRVASDVFDDVINNQRIRTTQGDFNVTIGERRFWYSQDGGVLDLDAYDAYLDQYFEEMRRINEFKERNK